MSLRNYDPQKDKRFTGSFRLPVAPRPKLTVCVLGNEAHCTQARALGVEAMVRAHCVCVWVPACVEVGGSVQLLLLRQRPLRRLRRAS